MRPLAFINVIVLIFIINSGVALPPCPTTCQPSCQAKLRSFTEGNKNYTTLYSPLPTQYPSYGLVDQTNIKPSDIRYPVTSHWTNPKFTPKENTIRLLVAGDVIPHADLQVSAAMHGGYDFLFAKIKPLVKKVDFAIANLETPIANSPLSGECYVFNASPILLSALKKAGFDALLTANNHALDQGDQGYIDTINAINKQNLISLGSNINSTQPHGGNPVIKVVTVKGFKLGLLNYTLLSNNPVGKYPKLFKYLPNQADRLSTITKDIETIKKAGAKYVIILFHWGAEQEYHLYPKKELQQLAHQLILNGADMIIGAHPHSIQPIEMVYVKDKQFVSKNTPGASAHAIVYSLGNFVSHQRGIAALGLIVTFKLAQTPQGIILASLTPHAVKVKMTLKEKQMQDSKRSFTYVDYQAEMLPFNVFLNYIKGHTPQTVSLPPTQ